MAERYFLMKKFLLLPLLLGSCFLFSQSPLQLVLRNYFRTHPFNMRFSTFITSLQQDPWFTTTSYQRRTDSSFFYLSGEYKNSNPFRYAPHQLQLVVAEDLFIHNYPLHTPDTIINLQLLGIADTGATGKNSVIREFKRFHNNRGTDFSDSNYKQVTKGGQTVAEMYDYFIFPFTISPLTIAWGQVPESQRYTFTITIRFKVRQNIADLVQEPGRL
jgi:hypothetical protein